MKGRFFQLGTFDIKGDYKSHTISFRIAKPEELGQSGIKLYSTLLSLRLIPRGRCGQEADFPRGGTGCASGSGVASVPWIS